jgi:threonine dehydrogenase-like Zn-dependent dehydrogenase
MKAAVLKGERDISIENVKEPQINPQEVLIKVKSVGVCGSEIHAYRNLNEIKKKFNVEGPLIMGHEFAGDVVQIGSEVKGLDIGTRVVIDPNRLCGWCHPCRMTKKNALCENLVVYGEAYAQFAKSHCENIYPLKKATSYDEAALSEPLACALRAMDLLSLNAGETFTVIGCGATGLLFVQLASLHGASYTFAISRRQESLIKAQELGADVAINNEDEDVKSIIRNKTQGEGAAVVVDTVGIPETMRMAVEIAGSGGRVCFFALPSEEEIVLPSWDFYDKELMITGSNRNPGTFQRAIDLVEAKKIETEPLITHRIALDEVPAFFPILVDRKKKNKAKLIKLMIHPWK